MVERLVRNEKVRSSNLLCSTLLKRLQYRWFWEMRRMIKIAFASGTQRRYHSDGWMSDWSGGGTWIWTTIGIALAVLSVVQINKLTGNCPDDRSLPWKQTRTR